MKSEGRHQKLLSQFGANLLVSVVACYGANSGEIVQSSFGDEIVFFGGGGGVRFYANNIN